jgi:hypothetical protein
MAKFHLLCVSSGALLAVTKKNCDTPRREGVGRPLKFRLDFPVCFVNFSFTNKLGISMLRCRYSNI